MNIFITGTSPNIGKTFVAAALSSVMQSLSYKTAVYKPIQLGAYEQNTFMIAPDINFVKNIDPYVTTETTYMLKSSMSPIIASEIENIKINPKIINKDFSILANKHDIVIVEGVGELLTPISPRFTVANLVNMLNLPIIIVTNPQEGSVSNTILTVNHATAMGIKINGIIINRYPEDNEEISIKTVPRLFEEYTDASVIGIIKDLYPSEMNGANIIENVLNGVDLEKVFDIRIPKLDL